ncbi:MAG: hypothetical protein KDK76_06030 [Chlamydiia bacterium]|nr:hypothetical protein [Chlamydiia bacterium]
MKGLLKLLLSLTVFCFGIMEGKDLCRLEFPFSPSFQSDRDLAIVQRFLLFSAESFAKHPHCVFGWEDEKDIFMSGPEGECEEFAVAFRCALETILKEGVAIDQFEELKKGFIHSLGGDLHNKELAQEINWELAHECRSTLDPLRLMMIEREQEVYCKNLQPSLTFFYPDKLCIQELGRSVAADFGSQTSVNSGHSPQLFYQLRLTPEDQNNISKMITSMGELGWLGLLQKKGTMEKLGDKIQPVHPLRFMGYVLITPSLKKQLPKIMNDLVKRKSFFNGHGKRTGFSQRMTNELNNNNFMQFIPGFAQSIGVSEQSLMRFIHARDWEGMIRHLM